MAFDLSITKKWLDDTLSGDGVIAGLIAGRIYGNLAPQSSLMPYIVIVYMAGSDVNAIGSRAVAQPLYQVKAVGKHEDLPTLRVIADRIDALLQDTRVVVFGYQVRVQRESPVDYPEIPPGTGVEYAHLGGMYRCWVSLAV